MKKNILVLALVVTSVIGVKAGLNIVTCSNSNPCGGSCYVYISGNGPAKGPGNCATSSDPSNNSDNYPCDCKLVTL
jgi:hypothetical protein